MSRVGSLKLDISKLKEFKIENNTIWATNGVNKFSMIIPGFLKEKIENGSVGFEFDENYFESNRLRRINYPMWGTFVSTLRTKIQGLISDYKKTLSIFGTGYRVDIKDKLLVFKLGHSHNKEVILPDYIKASTQNVDGCIHLVLQCYDKCLLGDFAFQLSKLRPLNGYSEKGIRDIEKPLHIKEVKKK